MIKLSVCISVHNTGKLLPRCLDSVLSQTYKNIEIILINNGSTDNSIYVMNQYADANDNIYIYEQEDRGLAQGRQSGVDKATGDYITFLDADDYIYPNMYEKMIDAIIQTGADIVECETKRDETILSSPYNGLYDTTQILKDYFDGKPILSMLWIRLYNKKLFNKPVFPQIYMNNEDIFAFPCLLNNASTIYFLKECLHIYSTDNENAEMKKIVENRYDDNKVWEIKIKALHAIDFIKEYIGESVIEEKYSNEFEHFKSRNITYFCVVEYKKMSALNIIKQLCEYFDMSEKQLNKFYKNNVSVPVFFDRIARIIGLRWSIRVYRFLKKVTRH